MYVWSCIMHANDEVYQLDAKNYDLLS